MKKKKIKIHNNNKLQLLQQKVKNNHGLLEQHSNIYTESNINTNSWFSLQEQIYNINNKHSQVTLNTSIPKEELTKCKKIKIYPTELQRNLIKTWMNAYVSMYNETIKLFRMNTYNHKKQILNWKQVRDEHMLNYKSKLIKNTNIDAHSLNGAIQDACASFKSALTNLKNRNIKYFRLRYIKCTKPNKVLKIEAQSFSKVKSTFFKSKLGDNMKTHSDYNLSQINRDCKLHYNSKTNEMMLLVPTLSTVYKNDDDNKNEYISLDPGIRSFLTGYTKTQDITIGENLTSQLKKHLNKIDKINSKGLNPKLQKKLEAKQYYRINNKVDDMHWKVIKYLINNNKNILIGNLSTKDIVKNNTSNNLNKNTKRTALLMKLYQFKQRLEYKCGINKTSYAEIDESYTSKTCSSCGNYKKNLGGNKIYKCDKCDIKINRDINGAKNILINGIKSGLVTAQ